MKQVQSVEYNIGASTAYTKTLNSIFLNQINLKTYIKRMNKNDDIKTRGLTVITNANVTI